MSKEEFDLVLLHMPKTGKLLEIGSYPFERTKDLIDLDYKVSGVDLNYNRILLGVKKCDIGIQKLLGMDNEWGYSSRFVDLVKYLEEI